MVDTPDKREDNRDYKGPGKFTSLVGRGAVEGITLAVIGGALVAAFSKNSRAILKGMRLSSKAMKADMMGSHEAAGEMMKTAHQIFESHDPVKGIRNVVAGIGGGGVVGGVHGMYRGYKNASAGKQQVQDLNNQID